MVHSLWISISITFAGGSAGSLTKRRATLVRAGVVSVGGICTAVEVGDVVFRIPAGAV